MAKMTFFTVCCTAKFADRFFYPIKQTNSQAQRETDRDREECCTLINFLQHVKESKAHSKIKNLSEWFHTHFSLFKLKFYSERNL